MSDEPLEPSATVVSTELPEAVQQEISKGANQGALTERAQGWIQPISADSFGGEDSRYEALFEQLIEEIAKIESPHLPEIDWKGIREWSETLTTTTTKDFTPLTALTIALFEQEGLPGLVEGIEMLSYLVAHHHAELHPKRMRRQGGAFRWFATQVERRVSLIEHPTEEDEALAKRCESALRLLGDNMRTHLGDEMPRLGPTLEVLQRTVYVPPAPEPEEPEEEPEEDADSNADEQEAETDDEQNPYADDGYGNDGYGDDGWGDPQGAQDDPYGGMGADPNAMMTPGHQPDMPPGAMPPGMQQPGMPQAGMQQPGMMAQPGMMPPMIMPMMMPMPAQHAAGQGESSAGNLSALQALLRQQPIPGIPETVDSDESSAVALEASARLIRKAGAYYLRAQPTLSVGYHLACVGSFLGVVPDGDRVSGKPSPNTLREMSEALKERMDYDRVRELATDLLEGDGLNLNALQLLGRALFRNGGEYATAYRVVASHAVAFYKRMDQNVDANMETLSWLGELMGDSDAPEPAPPPPAPANDEKGEKLAEDLAQLAYQAERAIARDGLEEGYRMLQSALNSATSVPHRFQVRLLLADACVQHGAANLAYPILQDLNGQIRQPISDWEPELVGKLAQTMLACLRQLDANAYPQANEERAEMMRLLSRIDPSGALREWGKGK